MSNSSEGRMVRNLMQALIVVFLLLVCAGLLLPGVSRVRGAAARMSCVNHLRQISLAVHNYADIHDGNQPHYFPSGTLVNPALQAEQRLSWMVILLPYMEQDNLYKKLDVNEGWESPKNRVAVDTPVKVYRCPSQVPPPEGSGSGRTSYFGIAGIGAHAAELPLSNRLCGFFGYDRRITLADIKDGTSCTFIAIEAPDKTTHWAAGGLATVRGVDPNVQPYLGESGPFGLAHIDRDPLPWDFGRRPRLTNAAMADGSVRPINASIDPRVFEALATIAGGEEVPVDW